MAREQSTRMDGAGQDKLGIYIKSVVKGGAADVDGQLQAGDQLLKVDGQSLVGITQEKAAEYLVRTGSVVVLEVGKQGAIYHGLATLLQQPSPVMTREETQEHLHGCTLIDSLCDANLIIGPSPMSLGDFMKRVHFNYEGDLSTRGIFTLQLSKKSCNNSQECPREGKKSVPEEFSDESSSGSEEEYEYEGKLNASRRMEAMQDFIYGLFQDKRGSTGLTRKLKREVDHLLVVIANQEGQINNWNTRMKG
uniref:PDZ domain-containing protein n=1 Tax=Timema cristinae TaxID=61476 RepID=A0A7R9D679_TIMCR|nr:unnamed protein product [Timema cristinae]